MDEALNINWLKLQKKFDEVFPFSDEREAQALACPVTDDECYHLLDFATIAAQLTGKAAAYLAWLAGRHQVSPTVILDACACYAINEGVPNPAYHAAGLVFLAENGFDLGGVEVSRGNGVFPAWIPG